MKPSAIPLVRSLPLPKFSRPVAIVWVFVAIVLCLMGLVVYGSGVLSAGRAFLAIESERAKAEKDAIYALSGFAAGGEEDDYFAFERAMGKVNKARALRRLPVGFASTDRVRDLSARV